MCKHISSCSVLLIFMQSYLAVFEYYNEYFNGNGISAFIFLRTVLNSLKMTLMIHREIANTILTICITLCLQILRWNHYNKTEHCFSCWLSNSMDANIRFLYLQDGYLSVEFFHAVPLQFASELNPYSLHALQIIKITWKFWKNRVLFDTIMY